MPTTASTKFPDSSGSKLTNSRPSRVSSLRLFPLLLVGLLLIGAAWWLRSSAWLHESTTRIKDLPELEAAVRQNPEDGTAQYYVAKRYYLARRFPEACTAYAAAARLAPNAARAHLGLGLSLFEVGDLQQAQRELRQALALNDRLDWAEYMLGKIDWLSGSNEQALPHLKRAIALAPRSAVAWYGLAVCQIQMERHDLAMNAIRQAAALDPNNARYHTTLGELLVYGEKPEQGRREYERALQLDPNYGPALALMGGLCLRDPPGKHSLPRAEELLLRATHLRAYRPANIYLDIGHLYFQTRRYKQAVPMLQEAIRRDPHDDRPYYVLVQAERRLGNQKAAEAANARFRHISSLRMDMDHLQGSIQQTSDDIAARLKLARIYTELGMASKAIRQYRICIRQQPGSPELAHELEQLLRQHAHVPADNPNGLL